MQANFIRYKTTSDCKLDSALILQSRDLWRDLAALHPGLSFKDSTIKKALEEIMLHDEPFEFDASAVSEWAATISKRIRMQARHISQSRLKTPAAEWLKELTGTTMKRPAIMKRPAAAAAAASENLDVGPEQDHEDQDDEEQEEKEKNDGEGEESEEEEEEQELDSTAVAETDQKVEFLYGYSREQNAAYRANAKDGLQEFSVDFKEPEKPTDSKAMLAKFGAEFVEIVGYSVAEHRQRMVVDLKTKRGALWEGEHAVSGKAVRIMKRADRRTILVLQHDGKQVLQLAFKIFAEEDVDALAPALEAMTSIAQAFVKNEVEIKDLSDYREKVLKDLGFKEAPAAAPVVRMRPAAAPAAEPSTAASSSSSGLVVPSTPLPKRLRTANEAKAKPDIFQAFFREVRPMSTSEYLDM